MNPLGRSGLRHFLHHPEQLVPAVLGVTLGVAVVVAMDLGIQSARESFRISSETVAGRATHQVTGVPGGVPDSLPAMLRIEGWVRDAAPVVEGTVVSTLLPDRPLRLLGIDPFSESSFRPFLAGDPGGFLDGVELMIDPSAVLLSRETADALGVGEGDSIPIHVGGRTHGLRVAGVLDPLDRWSRRGLVDLLVVDVSAAQDILGRQGRLDRVDLILPGGAVEPEWLEAVWALLPPGTSVEPVGVRTRAMSEMIGAFDLNLTALSLLGLVFGLFLIYNTMTFALVQRRRTFGIFRALGVSRGRVLRSVLTEAALLGIVGSALGLLLGVVLGRGLVRLVTRTITDLYFAVSVEGLFLPPTVLLKGAVLGVGATLLAALPPAWEAASTSPTSAMARSSIEGRVRRLVPGLTMLGGCLVVGGVGLLTLGSGGGSAGSEFALNRAFAGLFAIVVGMAFLVPLVTIGAMGVLRPLLTRTLGVLGGMAARGVVTALSRTAPAMAALVIAVSVTVGLGVMIESFRGSVIRWLDTTLQADLYVASPSSGSARTGGVLSQGLGEVARSLAEVVGVTETRAIELGGDFFGVRLHAVALAPEGEAGFALLQVGWEEVFSTFRAGNGFLVSEPFAYRQGLAPGDSLSLPGSLETVSLPILAVFRDYASDRGIVMLDRAVYERVWDDTAVTSLALHLRPGSSEAEVGMRLREAAGPDVLIEIRSNRELRALTLEVFDRTFLITRVLRLLAFLVAFVAVFSALMALQLERAREFGVLRAVGMTPGQSWRLITGQTGLMGIVAGALAVPVGLALAAAMIFVVNRRSFGWTMEMEIGVWFPLQAVLLALAGALLAGVHPSRRVAATSPGQALRNE